MTTEQKKLYRLVFDRCLDQGQLYPQAFREARKAVEAIGWVPSVDGDA